MLKRRENLKRLQQLERQSKIIFLQDGEGREFVFDKDNKDLYRIYKIKIENKGGEQVYVDLRKVN